LSGWRLPDRGSLRGMMMSPNPYRGFRFPPEVIEHAVWLYHCFSLSLRDVELIPARVGSSRLESRPTNCVCTVPTYLVQRMQIEAAA
jgi:transposase-like protein